MRGRIRAPRPESSLQRLPGLLRVSPAARHPPQASRGALQKSRPLRAARLSAVRPVPTAVPPPPHADPALCGRPRTRAASARRPLPAAPTPPPAGQRRRPTAPRPPQPPSQPRSRTPASLTSAQRVPPAPKARVAASRSRCRNAVNSHAPPAAVAVPGTLGKEELRGPSS